ncbi:uncharacterized protein PAN0_016d5372 [Moesziomyces antarcticus]|uniref:Uncharacterized protein n=1 Tax=Pseudozyma antarctica TaxID=84753 RepID=A0A081CKF0_PSEA2|nr:uncharacterized protein PAN0_016d5372 [Moesziomyces antarcticus]GAK67146.1 hypothetical protein PAN0_016d5372 [Moesziomyces antarcticus]
MTPCSRAIRSQLDLTIASSGAWSNSGGTLGSNHTVPNDVAQCASSDMAPNNGVHCGRVHAGSPPDAQIQRPSHPTPFVPLLCASQYRCMPPDYARHHGLPSKGEASDLTLRNAGSDAHRVQVRLRTNPPTQAAHSLHDPL